MKTMKEKKKINRRRAQRPDGVENPKEKYPDEYYDSFIESFQPNTRKRWFYRFFKRLFDIVVSFLMLVLVSPVMLVIAIAIKRDSKGPVIFKQERMGKDQQVFHCYKFRSMREDAPTDRPTSLLVDPEKYLTRVGRVLRRLSLDELPQLWNVFIGTMSFIGYRPLVLTESNCNDMRAKLHVFDLRPGISGYAQVRGRDDVYYKNKALLDAYYVKHASLWFDLKLLFATVAVVLRRDGNRDDQNNKDEKTDGRNTKAENGASENQ